ncbi:MAG: putative PEP-binding protein, partial [Actinomycetota bacterium]|nr:putative PEP-binding protein [Actinomycetota bacterium]
FDSATGDSIEALCHGIAASPGAASGKLCLSVDAVLEVVDAGEQAIMVAMETGPADEPGMRWAAGIVTAYGGLASHAAIYSRGLGLPAVCGVETLKVEEGQIRVGENVIPEGDIISVDGASGEIFVGEIEISDAAAPDELTTLLEWADELRSDKVEVWANADTEEEATEARSAGATGIGLCRTEHMFLGSRLPVIRQLLKASDPAERKTALLELEKAQQTDFEHVLGPMDGLPVTVRLLDAPLHEFLEETEEQNPMLGLRGIRLAIATEDLYRTQTRALLAAVKERISQGGNPKVEIMVPLVSLEEELVLVLRWIKDELNNSPIPIPVGTMIETPRAALIAGDLAKHIDFISFGTNDLTQMAFGFSRDDVEASVINEYIGKGLIEKSPFETLDVEGVGQLITMAISQSRQANPNIKIGICGEHGGDPASIRFLVEAGVDYVSCSPPRIPIARLISSQTLLV